MPLLAYLQWVLQYTTTSQRCVGDTVELCVRLPPGMRICSMDFPRHSALTLPCSPCTVNVPITRYKEGLQLIETMGKRGKKNPDWHKHELVKNSNSYVVQPVHSLWRRGIRVLGRKPCYIWWASPASYTYLLFDPPVRPIPDHDIITCRIDQGHFINNISIPIQLWWEFPFTLIQIQMNQLHDMTVVLSWLV